MATKQVHGLTLAVLGMALAVPGALSMLIPGLPSAFLVPMLIGLLCGLMSPRRSAEQAMGLAVPGLVVFSGLAGALSALRMMVRVGEVPGLTVFSGAIVGGISAALPFSLLFGLPLAAITRSWSGAPRPVAPQGADSAGPTSPEPATTPTRAEVDSLGRDAPEVP